PGDGPRLAAKAGHGSLIGRAGSQDHLEGNLAVEGDVPRQIDDAHATLPEFLDDLVAGNFTVANAGRLSGRGKLGMRRRRRYVFRLRDNRRWQARIGLDGQGAVKFELLFKPAGKTRKALPVVNQGRRVPQFLAEEEFAVDQLHGAFLVIQQPRVEIQV